MCTCSAKSLHKTASYSRRQQWHQMNLIPWRLCVYVYVYMYMYVCVYAVEGHRRRQ